MSSAGALALMVASVPVSFDGKSIRPTLSVAFAGNGGGRERTVSNRWRTEQQVRDRNSRGTGDALDSLNNRQRQRIGNGQGTRDGDPFPGSDRMEGTPQAPNGIGANP